MIMIRREQHSRMAHRSSTMQSPRRSKGSASDPIVVDAASSTPPKKPLQAADEGLSPCANKRPRASPRRIAPIKIFRTQQVEASTHVDPVVRESTTTLRELLLCSERSIQWIIISNFHIDFQLLLEEVPELVSANCLLCFYGSDINPGSMNQWNRVCMRDGGPSRFHAVCLTPSDPANSKNNPLPSKVSSICCTGTILRTNALVDSLRCTPFQVLPGWIL